MFRSIISGVAAVAFAAAASAATLTVRVSVNGEGGWGLNADPANVTPYEFTDQEASIGVGSLHILPITNMVNGDADKFTAGLLMGDLVADINAVSYDFMVEGAVDNAHQHFYLNVYTAYETQLNWYDCRFDYVPLTGSMNRSGNVACSNL